MTEANVQNVLDAIAAGFDAIVDDAMLRAAINAAYKALVGYGIFDDSPEMDTLEGRETFFGVLGEHLRNA